MLEKRRMVQEILNRHSGTYLRELFDPVQTHAIYGLADSFFPSVRMELKAVGITRFRVVKPRKGTYQKVSILCFKM